MKIPTKKLKTGFEIPAYGLGTWKMGGVREQSKKNDAKDLKGIHSAIEQGVTHIDTAEMYGDGHAEELIGQVITDFTRRDLFITSKASYDFSYDGIMRAAEKSLKRLGTDYLDLYLIHFMNPESPLDESIKAMDQLVDEGMIKNIGLSNFSWQAFDKAQSYAAHKIVCNQAHYSMMVREVEKKKVLKYCQDNDVMLTAWRPLQYGMLAADPPKIIQKLMDKYDKTAAQIAINWLTSQQNVITIAKTSTPSHVEENIGALNFKLTEKEIESIRKGYPDLKDKTGSTPLDESAFM